VTAGRPQLRVQAGVETNLVAQALRGNNGNLIAEALVGLEIEGEAGVVPLNDDLGGLLDCLRSDATHCTEMWTELLE
jgi:hypothetical protein